jgi:hypothetical protein
MILCRIKAKEERIAEGVRMRMKQTSENWSSRKKGNVSGGDGSIVISEAILADPLSPS